MLTAVNFMTAIKQLLARFLIRSAKKKKAGEALTSVLCEFGNAGAQLDEFVAKFVERLSPAVIATPEQAQSIMASRLNAIKFVNDRVYWGADTQRNYLAAVSKAASSEQSVPEEAIIEAATPPPPSPVRTQIARVTSKFRISASRNGATQQ